MERALIDFQHGFDAAIVSVLKTGEAYLVAVPMYVESL